MRLKTLEQKIKEAELRTWKWARNFKNVCFRRKWKVPNY